jgi:hypothetical protein
VLPNRINRIAAFSYVERILNPVGLGGRAVTIYYRTTPRRSSRARLEMCGRRRRIPSCQAGWCCSGRVLPLGLICKMTTTDLLTANRQSKDAVPGDNNGSSRRRQAPSSTTAFGIDAAMARRWPAFWLSREANFR